MHENAYRRMAFACLVLAAGAAVGVFVGTGVAGRIGSGVIAAAALLGAWRFWAVATGRGAPREAPAASVRPWER